MKRILITLALLFAIASVLHSAHPKVRFLAERMPAHPGKVALVAGDKRSDPFELPVNNLSSPQDPPARSFSLRTVEGDFTLADIELPAEGDSFILLLVAGKDAAFTPVVIIEGDPKFRPGDIYFRNLTEQTVSGAVGSAEFVILPDSGTFMTPKDAKPEGFFDVRMSVRGQDGDHTIATARWPEDNEARRYVFISKDAATGRITYRGVDEFIPPPKASP